MRRSLPFLSILYALVSVNAFNFEQHLGNLCPPFKPSFGLSGDLGTGMPNGCSVEQVQVVSSLKSFSEYLLI